MKYNLYKFNFNDSIKLNPIAVDEIDNSIKGKIELIEDEIAKEFIKEQDGKIGITSLGNKIRYNNVLKSLFGTKFDNYVLLKITENRRAFIKNFSDALINFSDLNIYLVILEKEFGINSKLVDNSFIRKQEIEDELTTFFSIFELKNPNINLYIIELKDFNNYRLESIEKYTKIYKK